MSNSVYRCPILQTFAKEKVVGKHSLQTELKYMPTIGLPDFLPKAM